MVLESMAMSSLVSMRSLSKAIVVIKSLSDVPLSKAKAIDSLSTVFKAMAMPSLKSMRPQSDVLKSIEPKSMSLACIIEVHRASVYVYRVSV